MVKIPKNIKIAGLDYKLIYPFDFEGDGYIGFHQFYPTTIKLSNDTIATEIIKETLLHESIHAVNAIFCSDILSEENIEIFSKGFYQVITDNNLCDRIFEKEDRDLLAPIKVNGFTYEVKYPATIASERFIQARVSSDRLCMYISGYGKDPHEKLSYDTLRILLFQCIIIAIQKSHCVVWEDSEVNINMALAIGLYSLFKQNKEFRKLFNN